MDITDFKLLEMIRFKILLLLYILFIVGSCNRGGNDVRNSISLPDNVDTVQNALFLIIKYLDSLPDIPKEKGITTFYAIDGDYIHINDFPKRKLNNTLMIPGLTSKTSREFIKLVFFLKKNFITSASKSGFNYWYFDYRELSYSNYEDSRDIILIRNISDTVGLYVENKIIDQKKNLLLVAPKTREEVLKNYNEIKIKNKQN